MLKKWFTNLSEKLNGFTPVKVSDYPRSQYTAYWEIIPTETVGGVRHDVHLIPYGEGERLDFTFTAASEDVIAKEIDQCIRTNMERFKR